MKKFFSLIIGSLLSIGMATAQTLAFPTAEGFGKYTTGGRGGEVVEVTTLEDNPSAPVVGSLRWAVQQHKGKPITVVFRVSGIIDLNGHDLRINRSNVTYAGQTAPGDGICIKGGCVNLGGSRNIIVRHLRFRLGVGGKDNVYNPGEPGSSSTFIEGGSLNWENGGQGIIDHCSFSWSAEENVGMYDNDHTTFQWCISSEGLYAAGHGKGNRSYGAVFGGKTATYHHNLLAHNYSRSPRFGATTKNDKHMLLDYINNVNYNWGSQGACYGGDNRQGDEGLFQLNMQNNYYKPGPARDGSKSHFFVGASYCNPSQGEQGSSYGDWHLSGNYMEGTWAAEKGVNEDNYKGMDFSAYTTQGVLPKEMKSPRIDTGKEFEVNMESAQDAFKSVLAKSGAFPRDSHDLRIVEEAATGTAKYYGSCSNGRAKGIIDKPSDSGGYPVYNTYDQIVDNDHDGMDDAWETKNGFDPTNAADRNTVLKDGYTALDAYLCSLVGEEVSLEKARPFDIIVAKDGTGDYTTINAAIEAAPDNGERTIIFVRNGVYEEKVFVGYEGGDSKKIISIIGESAEGVVITWHDYHGSTIKDYPGKGTITNAGGQYCATMTITAPEFYMENVTVQNSTNDAVGQAEAIYQSGDRQVLKNVIMDGYQDTHRTKKGRRYFFYDCKIMGNVDFIYGGGACYFYQCEIYSRARNNNKTKSGGYIVAPEDVAHSVYMHNDKVFNYEFVFNDCDITAEEGMKEVTLGRPWCDNNCGTIFMNSRIGSHIIPEGWSNSSVPNMSFAEYNNTNADGTPVDMSKRRSFVINMDEKDLHLLNADTMFYTVNSKSLFDPAASAVGVAAPMTVSNDGAGVITWDQITEARGYIVYLDGKIVGYTNGNMYYDPSAPAGTYTVRAIAQNGALSPISGTEYTLTAAKMSAALNYYVKEGEVSDYECVFTAVANPVEGGTVEPAEAKIIMGQKVTLTATPAEGWEFVNWVSDAGRFYSDQPVYTFEAEKSINFIANFKKKPLELSHHVPVATDGYDYELIDATQIPEGTPNAETGNTDWAIKNEYTSWVTATEAGIHVGTSRPVYYDPYNDANKLNSSTAISWGSGHEIRVYPAKPINIYVKGTKQIKFFINGGATPTGKLLMTINNQDTGESVTQTSRRNIGKSSSNPSDTINVFLDETKHYEINLSSKPLQKGTTAEIAVWAMKMWPGDPTGINDVEFNATEENAPVYNLHGQRVDALRKGQIYIRKGKKFMVK